MIELDFIIGLGIITFVLMVILMSLMIISRIQMEEEEADNEFEE